MEIETGLFGRSEILTPVDKITSQNVVDVLNSALVSHNVNSMQIDYLWRYMKGEQPILVRKKKVRPEICNKIVENHANEIVQFVSGYFLGEPVTYVRRGNRQKSSKEIELLNNYMFYEDKASHDKDLATWMAICGVAYRMVLPDKDAGTEKDNSPFEIDTLDPRYTFVVYHSGFGHKRMMGVCRVWREISPGECTCSYCGYTDQNYFEISNGVLQRWEPHMLGDIPIFEYRLNMARMGAFEPVLSLLDAINTVASNRIDGVEQFVQSFLKFINCEMDEDKVKALGELGAIILKSVDGQPGDVDVVSQELNQTQTQTLVDYMYDQILTICGMPTTTKGGTSTSDTGSAVLLRDGWQQCEARARDTELLFKKSEKQFLRLVLNIIKETTDIHLDLAEIECKFTRRQHDNLLTKTQSLLHMLEAGVCPEEAFATSGLFNDPMDVVSRSAKYLEKWEIEDEPMEPTAQLQNKLMDDDESNDE